MIEPDYARWILSAVAQSFAALTALTGVFGVYRMQLVSNRRAEVNRDAQQTLESAIRRGFCVGEETDRQRVQFRGLRKWIPGILENAKQFAQREVMKQRTADGSFHDTRSLPFILETALQADNRMLEPRRGRVKSGECPPQPA